MRMKEEESLREKTKFERAANLEWDRRRQLRIVRLNKKTLQKKLITCSPLKKIITISSLASILLILHCCFSFPSLDMFTLDQLLLAVFKVCFSIFFSCRRLFTSYVFLLLRSLLSSSPSSSMMSHCLISNCFLPEDFFTTSCFSSSMFFLWSSSFYLCQVYSRYTNI